MNGALRIERIGFGQSNITSLISDESGAGWVLREPPPGGHDPTAHNVLREARILNALADTGIPLPTVIGMDGPGAPAAADGDNARRLSTVEYARRLRPDHRGTRLGTGGSG
ncbi:phosphotransferase [Nocardia sp. CA-084685]|uniref:phosphotransferase n=1 Tax=Nocardia sp. CA-084685 TaxID=3239970 RepID=UPI003D99FEF4